jgi:hypothetical protein
MFALYLAHTYLSTFDDQYPAVNDPLRTVAMAYRLLEIVEEGSEKKAVKVQVSIREMSDDLIDSLIVPDEVETSNELASGSLLVDTSKRDLFSVLFYLRKYTPQERVTGVLNLYLTGFKQGYTFVSTLSKLFPKIVFTIYEKTPVKISGRAIRVVAKLLTAKDLRETKDMNVVLFSNTTTNNAILNSFKGWCVVLQGSTTYVPIETYCTLFTTGRENIAYSVYDESRKNDIEGTKKLTDRVKLYIREIDSKLRDTKRWMYSVGGTTLSFDEAALKYLSGSK